MDFSFLAPYILPADGNCTGNHEGPFREGTMGEYWSSKTFKDGCVAHLMFYEGVIRVWDSPVKSGQCDSSVRLVHD